VDPDPEPGAVLFNTKSGIRNQGWKKIKILDPGNEINITDHISNSKSLVTIISVILSFS
jgi:hypothetical protein